MRFEGQEKERKLNSSNLKREQLNCDCDFQEKEYDHILNPQYTEERMGKAERTEMDPHIVMLEKKTENTKNYTERIKNNATAVILPNPGDCHHLLLLLIIIIIFTAKVLIHVIFLLTRSNFSCFSAQRAETLFFDNVPVDKIGIKARCDDDVEDDWDLLFMMLSPIITLTTTIL